MSGDRPEWQPYFVGNDRQVGVEVKHRVRCATRAAGCSCRPRIRVSVGAGKSGKRRYASGATLHAARAEAARMQYDMQSSVDAGQPGTPAPLGQQTVSAAIDRYLDDLEHDRVLTYGRASSGSAFRPNGKRDRIGCLEIARSGPPARRGLPAAPGLGDRRLAELTHAHVGGQLGTDDRQGVLFGAAAGWRRRGSTPPPARPTGSRPRSSTSSARSSRSGNSGRRSGERR